MKKYLSIVALACLAFLLWSGAAGAQSSDLQLVLNRNFGFSLGDQIQGSFNLAVAGPEDMTSVTYLVDGKEITTVTQAPFRHTFSTDSYAAGRHRFAATAKTAGGQTLASNVIDAEIVTASGGFQSTTRVIGPILGIVFVVIAIMAGLQFLPMGHNKRRYEQGGVKNYGVAGGAICPKCGRPFARSVFGLNMIAGKLERCPYCGKWSITRPASIEALRAAEQTEAEGAMPSVRELTPEDRLRQQIEDSRLSR